MENNFLITQQTVVLTFNDETTVVPVNNVNIREIREALFSGDFALAKRLMDVRQAVETYTKGDIKIVNNTLFFQDEPLHNTLTSKIMEFFRAKEDFEPLVLFLHNLMKNPSRNSIEQLYSFLEHKNIPINKAGNFIAYKAVTCNYLDKWSRTVNNAIGQAPTMNRNKVDDNPGVGCSFGFHVGSLNYVQSYARGSDKIVLCEVNPKDVVSVPLCSSCQKVRVSTYKVIDDYTFALPSTCWDSIRVRMV